MATHQIADQTIKCTALGVIAYFAEHLGMPQETVLVLMPVVGLGLAWLSKKVGDPEIASFLAGAATETDEK